MSETPARSILPRIAITVVLLAALTIAFSTAPGVHAATLTVTNLNDGGAGSLRNAIDAAVSGDTITFGVTGTITLTSGELSIGKDLTIDGPGATSLIVSGNNSSRVFSTHHSTVMISGITISDGLVATGLNQGGAGILNSIGTLTLDGVVISNNHVPGPDVGGERVGGGIVNQDQGTLTLSNSTISGNSSDRGGGIFNSGGPSTMTVSNSTISGNTADGGGGIVNYGTLDLSSATVSNNHSTGGTNNIGGIASEAGQATLKNTIIANNAMGGDCGGTTPISSSGYNLISDASCTFSGPGDLNGQDPKLGPLADNGGPTQTQALLAGSPAVDAGSPDCPPPATDQRGVSRPQGPACDIGAFESQSAPPGTSRIWGDGDCRDRKSVGRERV